MVMKDENKTENSIVINENEMRGDKLIFDILIKEKLAHVIVIRGGANYHINLDGEDLGFYTKKNDGAIERFPQPKGAHSDLEAYFKPIEQKVDELEGAGVKWTKQIPAAPRVMQPNDAPKDGLDNTGTQGYDSLTDDGFTGSSGKPNEHPNEYQSRTGSSSNDFHEVEEES